MELSLHNPPDITLELKKDPMVVRINLCFTAIPLTVLPSLDAVRTQAIEQLSQTLTACQNMEAEPLGLAELAAAHFPTIAEFAEFNFSDRCSKAKIEILLSVHQVSG